MKNKLIEKKCPYCGEIISSLYEQQLNYNFEQHIQAHERRGDKKK